MMVSKPDHISSPEGTLVEGTTMTKTAVIMGTILLSVLVLCITALALLGKDPSVIVTFAVGTVIPTAGILYFGNKVEKTKDATEQVVHNTNGRMTELIENNRVLSEKVAALSAALPPAEATLIASTEYGVDENGKAFLRRDAR